MAQSYDSQKVPQPVPHLRLKILTAQLEILTDCTEAPGVPPHAPHEAGD